MGIFKRKVFQISYFYLFQREFKSKSQVMPVIVTSGESLIWDITEPHNLHLS